MKNNTFAIDAALAAIPPNPNTAAMIAMIKKPADQRNIKYDLRFLECCFFLSVRIKYYATIKILSINFKY
jgi:hypothetical protein